jgi:hypothetical protein
MGLTLLVGSVDELDGHFVATRFFTLGVPIVPLETLYVTGQTFERRGNASIHRYEGVQLKLRPVSLLAGYLRVHLPFWLVVGFAWANWGRTISWAALDFYPAVALPVLALWIASFFLGRPRGEVRARLKVLRTTTGMAVEPRWLPEDSLQNGIAGLEWRLGKAGVNVDLDWLAGHADTLPDEVVPAVWALATYHGEAEARWGALAARLWGRVGAANRADTPAPAAVRRPG